MARVWITGIAGFLGSHLADALMAEGHMVGGNDSLICGDVNNVPKGVYFAQVNCCKQGLMASELKKFKPDIVYHCAAVASEGFSVFSPSFITKNIYEASVATFSAAIAAGVQRIVYMSSMARYGKGGNPILEYGLETTLDKYGKQKTTGYSITVDENGYGGGVPFKEWYRPSPVDPYGIAKVAAEQTLKVLCETHDVKWAICVPHNIIGARQQVTPYRNVASIFLNRLKLGLPVYIYGDGEQKRCFSPVSDCIHSLVRVGRGDIDGEIVNIGPDGSEITINELLELCERTTGLVAERVYLAGRPVTDNVKEAFCSSDKARKLLGYEAQQSLEDCLREMLLALKPVPFDYNFPLEIISDKLPRTWREKL